MHKRTEHMIECAIDRMFSLLKNHKLNKFQETHLRKSLWHMMAAFNDGVPTSDKTQKDSFYWKETISDCTNNSIGCPICPPPFES